MDGADLERRNKLTLNDWLAYRMACVGTRLVATASQLRATEDLFSARVSLRAATECARELEQIMELVEGGNTIEARARLERLRIPAGTRKA